VTASQHLIVATIFQSFQRQIPRKPSRHRKRVLLRRREMRVQSCREGGLPLSPGVHRFRRCLIPLRFRRRCQRQRTALSSAENARLQSVAPNEGCEVLLDDSTIRSEGTSDFTCETEQFTTFR
jgi:hypothetical protein